jgi:hypothetical protein
LRLGLGALVASLVALALFDLALVPDLLMFRIHQPLRGLLLLSQLSAF